jgi:hypothetical protein
MQMQWAAEDNATAPPFSPTPSYHSQFHNNHTTFLSHQNIKAIYLALPFLGDMEEDEDEATRTLFHKDPQLGMHPGINWHPNYKDHAAATPIHSEYIPSSGFKILAPFYHYDLNTTSPELLLTHGHHCTVYSPPSGIH